MLLTTKRVQLEFVSPKIRAEYAIYDIRKAAESASKNLYARHNVQLQMPMVDDGRVIVEVKIPLDQVEHFAYGKRLRGISAYLLKYCNGRYNQYLVSRRLLTYTEVCGEMSRSSDIATPDLFEAIADFAKLMERTDEKAKEKVRNIMAILNEKE